MATALAGVLHEVEVFVWPDLNPFDLQADADLWALPDARDQQALDKLPPERRD